MTKLINPNFLTFTLGLGIIVSAILFLSFPFISYDSGYYLAVMRDMHEGAIFFKDIAVPYNPLAITILSIAYIINAEFAFQIALSINFLALFLSGYFVYKILILIGGKTKTNLFLSLSFVALCLIYDGNHIMLEPISVLFQLLGLYSYLHYRFNLKTKLLFITGLCISLSFLSKQYGLFILLPIGIDIILHFDLKELIKKTFWLVLGLLFPIILFFIYYFQYDIGILQFIEYLLGNGVNLDVGNGTGLNSTFKIKHLFNAYLFVPIIFLTPFFLYKIGLNKNSFFFIVMALSSCIVFVFGVYYHYYQYTFAYFIISYTYCFSQANFDINLKLIYVLLLIGLVKISVKFGSKIKHQISDNKTQFINETRLNQIIKSKSKVYLSGVSPAFYYLCDYESIDLSNIGYTFPGYFFPKTIIESLNTDNYILITEEYIDAYKPYFNSFDISEFSLITTDNKELKILALKKK